MLITTRKLVREFNIPLKRNTKFQNLLRFPLFYLIFLTITFAHAYLTDSATFEAIEQDEVWIFFASTDQCPEFTAFVLVHAS